MTVLHSSPFHTFTQLMRNDPDHAGSVRYQLTVKKPFDLGWYCVFLDQPLKMIGRHLEDIESYLWIQACIGINRDVQRINKLINQ